MGYLRRFLLFNSAGYDFADVHLDGHCDIAGGQGAGKTTLLNAILFPFVVEDSYMNIDRNEKTRFSLYYFPESANSFVIYEFMNNLSVPYTVFINRVGQALQFHFISAPFSLEWFYNGDDQVENWNEALAKVKAEGYHVKTLYTMRDFNETILGKGKAYNEQYSVIKSSKDKDAIRPILSAIFKGGYVTQEILKNAIMAAIMATNQVDSEYIDLGSHRRNLEGFVERLRDIEKMTVPGKDGKTAIQDLADKIFNSVDAYYDYQIQRNRIPGLLSYAMARASRELTNLVDNKERLKRQKATLKEEWEGKDNELQQSLQDAYGKRAEYQAEMKNIKVLKQKYREAGFPVESLVSWVRERPTHEARLKEATERFDALTADSRQLGLQMEAACEKNRLFYQNKELTLKKESDNTVAQYRAEQDTIRKQEAHERELIESEYGLLLRQDWKDSEMKLLDVLVGLSAKLAACETVEEIRSLVSSSSYSEKILPLLIAVAGRRGIEEETVESLKEKVKEARHRIEDELNRKESMEKEKAAKLTAISRKTAAEISRVEQLIKESNRKRKESLQAIINECKTEEESIRKDYQAKIHGNDPMIKSAVEELQHTIKDERLILEQTALYPSAVEDKIKMDEEQAVTEKWNEFNKLISTLLDKRKTAQDEFNEELGTIDAKIQDKDLAYRNLDVSIKKVQNYLDGHCSEQAAYEEARPIENDRNPLDILTEYNDVNERIRACQESISKLVPKLYEENMLSRIDTFQLGIGWSDNTGTFDDKLNIAEKLRVRLENPEDGMGLDKYIRVNTDIWLNEIRDISTVMGPVEVMLNQIQSLCRKVTSFIKKHNHTDCIDAFEMEINDNDTTDLVRLLKEVASFYQENYTILGFDNLFSNEDEPVNKKAINLLKKVSEELGKTSDNSISISSMFNIRMDIAEMGNVHKGLLYFKQPGSEGTAKVLKGMLYMTLLHIVLEKGQAENSRLICVIDEMNTVSPLNLKALTTFAEEAGVFLLCCGQNHTQSALDYSYNVWSEKYEDGTCTKYISLDVERMTKSIEDDNRQ